MADYQKPFMSELMSILPSVVSMMMKDKLARDQMAVQKEQFDITTKATSEFRAGQVKRDIAATDAATQRHLSDQTLAGMRYDAQTKRDIQQHQQLLKLKEIEAGLATDRYTAQVDRDIQQHKETIGLRKEEAKLTAHAREMDAINKALLLQGQQQHQFAIEGQRLKEHEEKIRSTMESENIKREALEVQKEINKGLAKEKE